MKKHLSVTALLFICLSALCSCMIDPSNVSNAEKVKRITIYKETEVWELAKAVESQNTRKIERIAKKIRNYWIFKIRNSEQHYLFGLLVWKNINLPKHCSNAEPTPMLSQNSRAQPRALYQAASYSWIDRKAKKDPKYVQLLLKYGADPNICYIGREEFLSAPGGVKSQGAIPLGRSSLMNSIGCGLEKMKILIEAGADVEYKSPDNQTAAICALYWRHEVDGVTHILNARDNVGDGLCVPIIRIIETFFLPITDALLCKIV